MNAAVRTAAQRVCAVIVTFEPDLARLRVLLEALQGQVAHALVVDNASGGVSGGFESPPAGVEFVRLLENRGVAAAQNVGIRRALERGSDFVLLLDQDSVPAPDMVSELVGAADAMHRAGHRVAAVGPALQGSGVTADFVRFGWFGYRRLAVSTARPWVACDMLIASGCLATRAALETVGDMDESLFIDKVDTEWCLRARACGFMLAGVSSAVLQHRLGEYTLRVWWMRWRQVPAHRPFRYYYIVRNSVLVWRRPYAGWRWRTADIKQCLHIVLFFGFLSEARSQNLPPMLRGLRDGLLSRAGPRSSARD
jgi:rhamnosyltransferase